MQTKTCLRYNICGLTHTYTHANTQALPIQTRNHTHSHSLSHTHSSTMCDVMRGRYDRSDYEDGLTCLTSNQSQGILFYLPSWFFLSQLFNNVSSIFFDDLASILYTLCYTSFYMQNWGFQNSDVYLQKKIGQHSLFRHNFSIVHTLMAVL